MDNGENKAMPGTKTLNDELVEALSKEKNWTPARYAEVLSILNSVSGFAIAPAWTPTNHGSYELALSVVRNNQNG